MIQCPFYALYFSAVFFAYPAPPAPKSPNLAGLQRDAKSPADFPGSHDGMDIAVPVNSPVYSMHKGTVFETGYSTTYGKYIILEFSNQWASLYAHLNKLLVKKGDQVKRKQKIALSGSTGQSANPHLHFELFKNKKNVDPSSYIHP